ncbi:MAG: hypothetical protein AB1428_13140 [Bacteroidota bacterium]
MKRIALVLLLAAEVASAGGIIVSTRSQIQARIVPGGMFAGDTLWIRGGTYNMLLECYANGTQANHVVIRSYPGELAVIDNAGTGEAHYVKGNYQEWRDLMFTNTNPNVTRSEAGINAGGSEGFRLINCYLTNSGATAFNPYWEAKNTLLYGSVVMYYGRFDDPERNNGYGVYGQNILPSKKRVEDNVIARGFGIWFTHVAGSSASKLDGFEFIGNSFFGHDLYEEKNPFTLIGHFEVGAGKAAEDVFSENMLYRASHIAGYNGDGLTRYTHTNNYYYKGSYVPTNVDYLANTGNTFTTNGNRVFVRPNKWKDKYTRNRGHVIVFNGANADAVSFTVPSAMLSQGEHYDVIDVQNYAGTPVVTGTYSGGAITVPMTSVAITQPSSIPARRQGNSMPRHTDKEFGCFLILGQLGTAAPPLPPQAPSGTFDVAPLSLSGPGSVTATWTSQNATSATLNAAVFPVSGTANFSVNATQIFTLVLTGPGGSTSYSRTVTVTPVVPPPPPPPVSYYDAVTVLGVTFQIRKACTDTTIFVPVRIQKGQ